MANKVIEKHIKSSIITYLTQVFVLKPFDYLWMRIVPQYIGYVSIFKPHCQTHRTDSWFCCCLWRRWYLFLLSFDSHYVSKMFNGWSIDNSLVYVSVIFAIIDEYRSNHARRNEYRLLMFNSVRRFVKTFIMTYFASSVLAE